MKKAVVLAVIGASVLAMAGCGKVKEVKPVPIQIEEDTTQVSQVGEEIYPGMDQTTAIIDMIVASSAKDEAKLATLSAYAEPDKALLDAFDKVFGRKVETGVEYLNSIIEEANVKTKEDIDKINADMAGKLKGTVTDYNIATVSVAENDQGEIKDVLMPMVLIDEVWYVLDIVNS